MQFPVLNQRSHSKRVDAASRCRIKTNIDKIEMYTRKGRIKVSHRLAGQAIATG
jgi:hypothetical protein